jgi:hypothetical protein
VPSELVGKKVKCPGCGMIFTASLEPEPAPETPVVLPEAEAPTEPAPPPPSRPARRQEEYYQEEPPQEDYDRQALGRRISRKRGLAALRAPAICLLITGVVGLLATTLFLFSTVVQTEEMILRNAPPPTDEDEREIQRNFVKFLLSPGMKVFNIASMAANLIVILSAIMMLIGKMRWLAYLGSVLAMINIDCCCCLPGLGFGIWSLVVLSRPEVQSAFD